MGLASCSLHISLYLHLSVSSLGSRATLELLCKAAQYWASTDVKTDFQKLADNNQELGNEYHS